MKLLAISTLAIIGFQCESLHILTPSLSSFSRKVVSSSHTSSIPLSQRKMVLENHVDGEKQIIHFNHAGSSPSPPCVFDRVVNHMKLEQNIGGYAAAQEVDHELSEVYLNVARLLHAPSFYQATDHGLPNNDIALVESATVAWTRIFYSMVEYLDKKPNPNSNIDGTNVKQKKIILVSEAEYAANIVAVCEWAKQEQHNHNWTVVAIPSTTTTKVRHGGGISSGIVNIEIFQQMLDGQYMHGTEVLDPSCIALVCITHVPTNSGIINPVNDVGRIIERYNTVDRSDNKDIEWKSPQILYLVDACQSIGQMDVDVQEMKCHAITGTGRKYLRGPRGTGFLYIKYDLCQRLKPSHIDHACAPITIVPPQYPNNACSSGKGIEELLNIDFRDGAGRFEFWESNIANKLGLGEAVQYAMDSIGLVSIAKQCSYLSQTLRQRLKDIPKVSLHHGDDYNDDDDCTKYCGIVTFSVENVDPNQVKEYMWSGLDSTRFTLSVVPATSTPLDSATSKVPILVRASVTYTNTVEEIDQFCQHLQDAIDSKWSNP